MTITPNLVLKKIIEHYVLTDYGKYHQGDLYELHAFMRIAREIYPLVWFEMSNTPTPIIQPTHNQFVTQRVTLILATRTDKSWLNDTRYIETFEKVLFPLYESITEMVIKSQYIELIGDFSRKDHPNYQVVENKNEVTDYWDVITLSFEARFNEVHCLT